MQEFPRSQLENQKESFIESDLKTWRSSSSPKFKFQDGRLTYNMVVKKKKKSCRFIIWFFFNFKLFFPKFSTFIVKNKIIIALIKGLVLLWCILLILGCKNL